MRQYLYLPKLYISGGDFSAGNFLPHGRESLWYPSLIAFLAYFGTLDIASIFNFYLVLLMVGTLYGLCLSALSQGRINFNSFCLVLCIFLANPLMNYIISTGRPYILIGYLCTTLLYFLLLNFNKRNSDNLYILFVSLVGGALVSVNHLGLAILGFFFIALFISNYSVLNKKYITLISISGISAFMYALPFYVRTYFMGHLFYPFTPDCKIPINEFTGLLAPIKAVFIISTRNCQGGCSAHIGILYLSFFPILFYFIVKKRLWHIRILFFVFVFILLYYFIWLSKIPQARSLIGIFPPYLLLLYLLVDLKKPLYKYAICLFSVLMIAYSVLQLGRFGYVNYLLGKQSKVDFVYHVLNKWGSNEKFYDEPNEIVNYIISNFQNNDVVFCDGVFPLTLLPNKVFNVSFEKQGQIKGHNTIFICQNSVQQMLTPLKRFKNYTLYAYQ
ncbi:hypothetical protein [Candidatus Kuenenia sp.]|uniref:hypothetical protein n=1 Tax=Candidatus Kuenenia sp. TaxID=2499824 RepID=UPI00321FBE60